MSTKVIVGSIVAILIVIVGIALVRPGVTNGPEASATPGASPAASVSPVASGSPAAAANGATKTIQVHAAHFKYDLKDIAVNKGDRVKIVFTNDEGFHDFVIDEFNVRTPQIKAGNSATVEFVAATAGTFQYYCSVGQHRAMGMWGTLTVR